MKVRSNLVLIAIAMALSLVTTLLILNKLSLTTNRTATSKGVPVVVAIHALNAHEAITSKDVQLENLPSGAISQGAFPTLTQVVGHYTTVPWFSGQQVVSGMVTSSNSPAEFPLHIPQGYRAFTIADDAVIGVDHLISPGDHVDILVSYTNQGAKVPTTRTILQDVLVLDVDNGPANANDSSPSASGQSANTRGTATGSKLDTMTLAVNPTQSEQLDFAYTFGQLHVALRSPADDTATGLADVTGAGQ